MSRRVAYLLFQSHRKGSYLHDAEVSVQAGQLRDAGIDTDVYETVFDGDNTVENERLLALLAERLLATRYDLVVVSRLWDVSVTHALIDAVRARGGTPPRMLLQPNKTWDDDLGPYDFVSPGTTVTVVDAVARADEADALAAIPGLIWRGDDGAVRTNPGGTIVNENAVDLYRLRPYFKRIHVDPSVATKSTHYVVYGNPGCPYRRSIKEVEAWRDVELDATITNTKGCSFCNINLSQDYRFVHGIAEHVVDQLENIQRDVPDAELVILLDQDPFPYLPEVFERMIERRTPHVHLLIQARADLFVRRKEKFERAMALARAGGYRCTPFLIGIENFHGPTLEFYNKGVTAETNIEVLNYLRGVHAAFPDVFDRNHVSPGFILWHPWVSFESLRVNVDAILQHGFDEFRSEVALSKIRLYPDIPFYWKARSDGLFLDAYADHGFDSARRYGYHEEAPYRFAHADAQVAYTVLATVCREHEPIEELRLLALVLDWVDAHRADVDVMCEEALSAPTSLLARFMASHGGEVLLLRKQHHPARAAERVSREAEPVLRLLFAPYWMQRSTDGGRLGMLQVRRVDGHIEAVFGVPTPDGKAGGRPLFRVRLAPRSSAPHFRHTQRWNVSYLVDDMGEATRDGLGEVLPALLSRLGEVEQSVARQQALVGALGAAPPSAGAPRA